MACVRPVAGFTEQVSVAFGDGVAADDEPVIDFLGDVGGFLGGESGDELS